jgi:hypothetical protein
MAENFNKAISQNFDKAYTEAKKAYDEAKDEQTKKLYADMLAGYDKTKQEMAQQAPAADSATTYNRQLLGKYENVLKAYATELAKYEEKDGDVDKGMAEMQKNLANAGKK